ncbi:MAG: nucleotidyltransferase domain-containing protein [bacterium]|nr:nucleotidyltransferase domain-containing protein [bacterium]MBU1916955.1 nucleotidyltransferase domain-containing protein [bacterium]
MEYNNIIHKLLNDNNNIKVVSLLLKHEDGMSGRSLAQLAGVSTFKMHQVLKLLTTQGILRQTAMGKAYIYRVNREHTLVNDLLSPIIDYQRNLYENLGNEVAACLDFKPLSIILYGSVARGDEEADSDLDLFLVYKNEDKPEPISQEALLFDTITRRYGNQVTMSRSYLCDFLKRYKERDPLVSNIIKEGKVIHGMSLMDLLSYKSEL